LFGCCIYRGLPMSKLRFLASLAGALALTAGLFSSVPSAEAGRESSKSDVQSHDRGAGIAERRVERRANRGQGRMERAQGGVNRGQRRINRSETRSERRAGKRATTSERRANRSKQGIKRSDRRIRRGDGRVHRNKHRTHRYERRKHGKRYRHRSNKHRHYYNGFFYASPWWLYSAPTLGYEWSDWDLHVEWCHDRYRSYNERRDAYKGYDGLWHRCISPYSD